MLCFCSDCVIVGAMNIHKSIATLIGSTPLVELVHIKERYGFAATLAVKIEFLNPGGSVKDRAALFMLEEAEKNGTVREGSVLIEPTSGNTGIALAALCARKGYKLILTMPENMSLERRMLLKAYGAELVLTDAARGMGGAIAKAEELVCTMPSAFMPSQFTNPANPRAHFTTTGPEIWDDTDGKVDIFVAGVGTGGTLSGTGKYLKSKKDSVRVYAVEPENSAVLSGKPRGKHGIQGIGAGFIPDNLDKGVYTGVIAVSDEDAQSAACELAQTEGLLCGISSGAALCAGIKLARKEENAGKLIVALLPDGGERYLSAGLFGA